MRALQVLAGAAVFALFWIAKPVGVGLFLGALVAFTLQPPYQHLRSRRNWKASNAAALCVACAMVFVTAAVSVFAAVFVAHGVSVVEALPGLVAPNSKLRTFGEHTLSRLHVDPATAINHLQEQAMSATSRTAGFAAGIASTTLGSLLTLFFMTLAAYYVLRHWDEIVKHAERISPLLPTHTRTLLGQFRQTSSQVLRGTVVTGIVQGVFAGIGYWIFGIPDPAFFGALTAVASLVPAVGTLLIWVPAGIYLIAIDHIGRAVGLLVYATVLVVGVTDYVVRPRLVGSEKGVPAILTFLSLFGGIEVFGVIGLILGPVIVTMCVAVLRTYEHAIEPAEMK